MIVGIVGFSTRLCRCCLFQLDCLELGPILYQAVMRLDVVFREDQATCTRVRRNYAEPASLCRPRFDLQIDWLGHLVTEFPISQVPRLERLAVVFVVSPAQRDVVVAITQSVLCFGPLGQLFSFLHHIFINASHI